MERFARAYSHLARRSRIELQVSPGDSERRYPVQLLGVMQSDRNLLLAAPANADRSLIAVHQGQVMTCRWLNPTTVFYFRAAISKLAFEPVPVMYLGQLHEVRRRRLRSLPRAHCALSASVRSPQFLHAALITDLSVGGAQIGTDSDLGLRQGQAIELSLRPQLLDRDFVVTLPCTVSACPGNLDAEHPEIHFYGLNFIAPGEKELLILHGYVQERLAQEADLLGQMLLGEPDSGPATD